MFLEDDEPNLETAFKVVAIMQTITEELGESEKKLWRKMLGISSTPSTNNGIKKKTEQSISDKR